MRIDYSKTVTEIKQPGWIADPDRPGSSKYSEAAETIRVRSKIAYLHFDSWTNLVQTAERSPLNPEYKMQQSRRYGDYNEAIRLGAFGWTEGAKRIRAIATPFYEQLSRETFRPMPYFAEEGGAIDMGRYLAGESEAFLQWRESDELSYGKTKRHVKIAYNISASGGLASQVFDRGGHLCALIDLLESQGRRVTLDLFDGAVRNGRITNSVGKSGQSLRLAQGGTQIYVRAQLKAADQPVNLEHLAFALAHPDCLRGLVFAIEEALPEPFFKATYEQPIDPPDLEEDADIILTSQYLRDIPNMAQWVRKVLTDQGIEFTEE